MIPPTLVAFGAAIIVAILFSLAVARSNLNWFRPDIHGRQTDTRSARTQRRRVEPEFEKMVCIDQIMNWNVLQRLLKEQPAKVKLVEEIAFAAGGVLMEVAEKHSFRLPWRIDATKTTGSIFAIELSGTLQVRHPKVVIDAEENYALPLTVVLTDSEGRIAKLLVMPPAPDPDGVVDQLEEHRGATRVRHTIFFIGIGAIEIARSDGWIDSLALLKGCSVPEEFKVGDEVAIMIHSRHPQFCKTSYWEIGHVTSKMIIKTFYRGRRHQ
jgi:hypothetical protein